MRLDDGGLAGGSAAMRRALADPGVRLLRWSRRARTPTSTRGGRETPLPEPGDRLAATVLERDGERAGRARPRRRAARGARAARARSRPPRGWRSTTSAWPTRRARSRGAASRQRIVAAGDAERRRLERDLHDGAQQRLVALAVRAARARASRRRWGQTSCSPTTSTTSPRELDARDGRHPRARARHPARRCSTRRGSAPALEALADRVAAAGRRRRAARAGGSRTSSRRRRTSPPARRSPTCSSTRTRSTSRCAAAVDDGRLVLTRRRRRPRRRGPAQGKRPGRARRPARGARRLARGRRAPPASGTTRSCARPCLSRTVARR